MHERQLPNVQGSSIGGFPELRSLLSMLFMLFLVVSSKRRDGTCYLRDNSCIQASPLATRPCGVEG